MLRGKWYCRGVWGLLQERLSEVKSVPSEITATRVKHKMHGFIVNEIH